MALGKWCQMYRDPTCEGDGPATLLAIYRARDDIGPQRRQRGTHKHSMAQGTGGHYYNILAPSPTFRILKEDWLQVLGSRQFGKRVYDLGLLRGAPTACRDEPEALLERV